MMERLLKRGDAIAREAQRRGVAQLAEHLRARFGAGAVRTDEADVVVRWRGLVRRWLTEPGLRFLAGILK
jgi:hypothetical protein